MIMGRILSDRIINSHFDKRAECIKEMAFPDAVESFGEVRCKEVGQHWTFIPQKQVLSKF